LIPYGRQSVSEEDIAAVVQVLRSDYLTQGPVVPRFEDAFARLCGVPHAVAVNSATSALHIACLAVGVGKGDWVWTTPNSFVASANCALYCGANVDFVDIDPETRNMSAESLAERLAGAEKTGKLPKAVVPVHFAGAPCDMQAIHALAKEFGFYVIEDASHAVAARFEGGIIGDCRYSDIAVFSFHPVKIITTAEGGLATTRSDELATRMRILRTHGIVRDPAKFVVPNAGSWHYEQQCLGFNYRMTDVHAALGLSQLERVNDWILRRTHLADRYDAKLAGLPLKLPTRSPRWTSAWHLYVIELVGSGIDRANVVEAMRAAGIGVNVHYIPIHTQPYYRALGFHPGQFPASEAYYSRCLSLPLYPALTDGQQDQVVRALEAILT
jgi:UDP-4-amino-4,6-dideoxy-N-acetyl-beta-L-altrosamine transaminase